MSRQLPAPGAVRPRPLAERRGGLAELVVDQLQVTTPVHGGSTGWDASDPERAHVRRADPVTPVRLLSIRGQLRFWWRATHGCTLPSLEVMKRVEDALWGNASSPGQVQVRLEGTFQRQDMLLFRPTQSPSGKWNPRPVEGLEDLAYGAFALQPRAGLLREPPPGVLSLVVGSGKLVVHVPETLRLEGDEAALGGLLVRQQVEDAVAAWLLFGGIGGRTRRGFGAVTGRPSWKLPQVAEFLRRFSTPSGRLVRLVPSLHGARFRWAPAARPSDLEALKDALGRMKRYRQGPGVGRNPGQQPNRPGRSRWPEPEAIRLLLKQSSPEHRERFVRVDKFPRGRFGMPVIFHFKDENQGEPSETKLQPEGFDRMASPVLLRPVREGGSTRALALVLNVPEADLAPLQLKSKPQSFSVDAHLSGDEAARIKPLEGKADVLEAFLTFFSR